MQVPLLLGLQAFLFYVPSWFWKQLYWKSGVPRACDVKKARIEGPFNACLLIQFTYEYLIKRYMSTRSSIV